MECKDHKIRVESSLCSSLDEMGKVVHEVDSSRLVGLEGDHPVPAQDPEPFPWAKAAVEKIWTADLYLPEDRNLSEARYKEVWTYRVAKIVSGEYRKAHPEVS